MESSELFSSRLWQLLKQRTPALENLVIESYVRGLSTRDIEELFTDSDGHSLISEDGVSELTDQLWDDYQAYCTRDLSSYDVEYLFLDASLQRLKCPAKHRKAVRTTNLLERAFGEQKSSHDSLPKKAV